MTGTVTIEFFIVCFGLVQLAYLGTFAIDFYFFSRPVNFVDLSKAADLTPAEFPYIVLFYPVLRELESTMRTTFLALERIDYPKDRYRVVAIPNGDDTETLAALHRLKRDFGFLQIVKVPPTSHRSWKPVWDGWNRTEKAYWWHKGPRAKNKDLPPKKTRQLIYAFYNIAAALSKSEDFLVNYIDADSCPPSDHFLAAAVGIKDFDVLQAQNIAGNLNTSMAASWHAFDHMAWDGHKYPHLSANGKHPYWVLGKGLFFKASDLLELGGFHPWLTIEDPEVGMRFWTNGKRLGIIENPLVEEVPSTFAHGITQRKRWVAGFFQSLSSPLKDMGMRPVDRWRARLNFVPCLSLWLNSVGLPLGIWATYDHFWGWASVPLPLLALGLFNVALFALMLAALYIKTWNRSARVLKSRRARLWYLARINPVFVLAWWLVWLIPLFIGFRMFLRDEGLVWERTEKTDANHALVRTVIGRPKLRAPAPAVSLPIPLDQDKETSAVVIPFPLPEHQSKSRRSGEYLNG